MKTQTSKAFLLYPHRCSLRPFEKNQTHHPRHWHEVFHRHRCFHPIPNHRNHRFLRHFSPQILNRYRSFLMLGCLTTLQTSATQNLAYSFVTTLYTVSVEATVFVVTLIFGLATMPYFSAFCNLRFCLQSFCIFCNH